MKTYWMAQDLLEYAVVLFWPLTVVLVALVMLLSWRHRRRPMERSRRRLFRLASLAVGALVAGLLFETAGVVFAIQSESLGELPSFSTTEPRPANKRLIVGLGGSTMVGEPYHEYFSIPSLVAWKLNQLRPDRRYEFLLLARRGDDLDAQFRRLTELQKRPDYLLIYSGHNEFTKKFRASETASGWWDRWRRATPGLRMCCELLNRAQISREPSSADRSFFDAPVVSPEQWRQCVDGYRQRLETILQWAKREDVCVILMTPAGNLLDFDPNRTVATDDQAPKQDDYRLLLKQLQSGRSRMPLAELSDVIRGLAELEFYAGRLAAMAGDHELANTLLQRAADHDGFPMRASSDFQEIVRRLGEQYGAPVIDAPRLLQEARPGDMNATLLGDYWFHDAHHLTLDGVVVLVGRVLQEVLAMEDSPQQEETPSEANVTVAEVEQAFGIRAADWAKIFVSRANWYTTTFGFRYDNSFRQSQAHKNAGLASTWMARASSEANSR